MPPLPSASAAVPGFRWPPRADAVAPTPAALRVPLAAEGGAPVFQRLSPPVAVLAPV